MEKEEFSGESFASRRQRLIFALWVLSVIWICHQALLPCVFHTALVNDKDVSPVRWIKCDDIILCGNLEVPLDYHESSAGTAVLALAKYPATHTSSRLGTIFLDLGGSGASSMANFFAFASYLSDVLEGRYDLIVWDVRGMNGTTPHIECFSSQPAQELFYIRSTREAPLSVGDLSDPTDMAIFLAQLHLEDARNEALIDLCLNRTDISIIRNMGTTTVVRDLELMARTIEPGRPVNYWGFSYGTFVGTVFLNMFPHRAGRVVLDGVADPIIWTENHRIQRATSFLGDVQATFHGFVDECAKAGPIGCRLASNSSCAGDIERKVVHVLEELYIRPLPVPHARRPGVLTKGTVVGFLFWSLFEPSSWPLAADYLQSAIDGDGAPILNEVQPDIHTNASMPAETIMGLVAVPCLDGRPYTPAERRNGIQEIVDSVTEAMEISPIFGSMAYLPDMCHLWPVVPTERYAGPFNTTLRNEILIVGNTYDPGSPMDNTRRLHSWLNGSFLIQQDGYGHTSLVQESSCTNGLIRDYFVHGKVPKERETLCAVDDPIFPGDAPIMKSTMEMDRHRFRSHSAWRTSYAA